jgi:nitroreductase
MTFNDLMKKRHSVRDFSDKQVSRADLEAIMQDAALTPSWADSQIWKVAIATGNTMKKIRQHHYDATVQGQPTSEEIPFLHRGAMGQQGAQNAAKWSYGFRSFVRSEPNAIGEAAANLFNAPAAVYLLAPKSKSARATFDLGALQQSIMLAAADRGIDSMPAMEFALYTDYLHQVLDISDDYVIVSGVGLGYESDALINKYRAPKMAPAEFVTIKD